MATDHDDQCHLFVFIVDCSSLRWFQCSLLYRVLFVAPKPAATLDRGGIGVDKVAPAASCSCILATLDGWRPNTHQPPLLGVSPSSANLTLLSIYRAGCYHPHNHLCGFLLMLKACDEGAVRSLATAAATADNCWLPFRNWEVAVPHHRHDCALLKVLGADTAGPLLWPNAK